MQPGFFANAVGMHAFDCTTKASLEDQSHAWHLQEVDSAWQAEADRLQAEGLLSLPDHEYVRWRSTPAGLLAARARVAELLAAAQPRLDAMHKQVCLLHA